MSQEGKNKTLRVIEDAASTYGLKFDVDDMIVKMASQDQTKILHIKQQLATIDHTPQHPVYPFMIQEAIMDLNEEGGSTKDSISQFIMRKYDVFQVVHVAKLIEQLEKLVEKEEIVFTPENRYRLPAVDSSSPPELNQRNRQLVQCEQDRRSNKMQNVNERIEVQGDRNGIMEVEDQPESDRTNEPQALQSEGVENQNHLQEDQVRASEEKRLEMTAEKVSQVIQGQSKLIEEEYRQPAEGVEEGRRGKEQIQVSGNEATGERSQLQLQEVQVTEDQVEAERRSKATEDLHNVQHLENEGIEGKAEPQVSQDLHAEEHSQLEQTNIRGIDMEIETRGKEVKVIGEQKTLQEQDYDVGNNATEISHTPELYIEKPEDEATIAMPSSSQTSQQLDHAGSSLLIHTMKKKCINVWKKLKETEHELMEAFSCLNSMEGAQNIAFLPIMREALAIRESEPKALLNSNYLPTGSVQLGQNQKIELPKLKRTADFEITALQESFQIQKRQPLPGNYEWGPKYQTESISISPAWLIMDSKQLEVEKHEDFPSFKGHLELSGPEKCSKSCPVAGSSNAHMESQELNLEQQLEHHRTIVEDLQTSVNMEDIEQEQQSDVPGLKMALEKNLSIVEEKLTPTEDLAIDTDQVEPKKPPGPGFELTVEQLSHEQRQSVVPCGDARELESMPIKVQKLELSIQERPIEVQMTTAEQQIRTKQQTQGKELRPQDQRASESESGNAGATYDQQLPNIEMLQDPKQIFVVDESSRLINQKKNGGCSKLRKIEVELPRRQLWPRGSKASESNRAHSTNANDHDPTLSSIKLDRQQKLDHPINGRPQKQKPKEVEKLSQPVEQEVKHRGNRKHLRSQLAPITSDEVQMLENTRQDEPTTAGDFIQTQQQLQQQQQPQQRQLQPRGQCSSEVEQTTDKTKEESLPLQNQIEQKSLLTYQRRGRPIKLKPDVDAAEGEILPVDGQDHHEELLSQIEGQRPKAKTSTELTVRILSSDHQTHNEHQPKKCSRGRPPKLTSAALRTVNVPLPLQDQHKQKRQQHSHQQQQKWPNSAAQVRVTRSRAAATYTTCQEEKAQKHKSDGNNQSVISYLFDGQYVD